MSQNLWKTARFDFFTPSEGAVLPQSVSLARDRWFQVFAQILENLLLALLDFEKDRF
jgi:hypothetical protein